jgi:hypothetical protein
MNMPSFTADASLYQARNHYRSAAAGRFLDSGGTTVTPQVSMARARIRRIPGPFGDIVIIGGPLDPSDPLPCHGSYVCIRFFGTDYCFWTCEVV